MRMSIRVLFALLLTTVFPALACAQFQEPTADELKMTADPKAPGVSAVYFYREEKTDDQLHYHSFYARIKVLTEKGKELATVQIPYEHGKFQVSAIQGRTIHADGAVISLTAKPSDLLDFKNAGRQYNQMTFTLPDAEVGSILEYRLQIRYADDAVSSPEWIIQQPYFVHKAHYFFNSGLYIGQTITNSRGELLDGLMYSQRLGPNEQIVRDTKNRFTLDLTDIPALPDDDYMPPLNTIRWSVVFYYTGVSNGKEYWANEARHWAKSVNSFTSPSSVLKKAAADLLSAGDSEEARARKIYAAVMKIENRDFMGAGAGHNDKGSKDASGLWKQQSGSSDEIALTYVALARAAGLRAWPMQVVDRDRATFEPTYLNAGQLNDYIAIVQIDGKNVYLDPGEKMCAFGDLHWKHQLASGFRMTDKEPEIAETPAEPPKAADIQRTANVTINEQGSVDGTVRLIMKGPEALYWRQYSLVYDKSEVNKAFNDWLSQNLPDGVAADFDHFDGMEDYESNLVATARLKGTLGSATGTRLILPGLFFDSRGKHPFVAQEHRTVPIDLHYASMEENEATYHLAAGVSVGSIPKATDVLWGEHGSLTIRLARTDNSVTVTRSLVRNSALLNAGYYPALRDFYMQMSEADQQQLVLNRAKTSAGN